MNSEEPAVAPTMREAALDIVRRLQHERFAAFWVGGCVRDRLRGQEPKDYDIATSARPEQIERFFPQNIPVGRQFGVIVTFHSGFTFQIATFRAEAGYEDGRHPTKVVFCDAEEDARRRDFTINGLFYDPVRDQLFDWVGGRADLAQRIIRTIGPPAERFAEDHLRLLRAIRFAAQLNFSLESSTRLAIQSLAPYIATVSAERIREELIRLIQSPHAARGLELLRETGLLAILLPEINATIGCDQSPTWHPEGDVYQHLCRMLDQLPLDSDPLLPWAVLLHDIAKPVTHRRDESTGDIHFYGHEKVGADIAQKLLERLRFSRKQIDTVTACVRNHMQFKDVLRMRKATLKRLLARPTFALELELHRLDCLGSHGRLDHFEFLVAEASRIPPEVAAPAPLLSGDDLLAMGMAAGPEMGALLENIRERQLQEELTTRDNALSFAREQLMRAPRRSGEEKSCKETRR